MLSARPPSQTARRSIHQPVMVREVLQALALEPGLTVVDGTVGGGGHSARILECLGAHGRLIGLDRDASMLERARSVLPAGNVTLVHASYADLRAVLDQLALAAVDRIFVDLGLSSDQLADESRGFSFDAEGPLDMRYDVSVGRPAWQWLAECDQAALQQILEEYGEEPHSRRIAAAIVSHRRQHPVQSARDLSQLIVRTIGGAGRDRHPATRTFQALRIAVNQELQHVSRALKETFPACLTAGGLLAVLTFHSLEDRIVKQAFRDRTVWQELTPKPLEPSPAEVRVNPRSRSARLRVARRLPPRSSAAKAETASEGVIERKQIASATTARAQQEESRARGGPP
uniref:Ribosomal RNA small subunit methyltransferase H n=1 Tax=Schlesneria paludicola TaxID=360056 RepID=A0A7C4LNK8_9PLAN